MIIKRKEAAAVINPRHWLLVYGRRKVGKTFLLKELCQFKNYYTIRRDLGILSPQGELSPSEFMKEIKSHLENNKTVVIDEFQRLKENVWEEISFQHPKGKVILSGSSLRVVKKVFEPQSPLLGFFTPQKIGFISPSDMLLNLDGSIEAATFLREPWLVPLYNSEEITEFIYNVVTKAKPTIVSLVGEIFTEEERELNKRYQTIISLIGSGIWKTNELTSHLYTKGLIPEPSPAHLVQYLKNLEEMELVESIKLYKNKGNYYRLSSPVMSIYYYLNSRYDLGSRQISLKEMEPTIIKLIHLEVQNFIADLFAEIYGGRKEYFISPDKEIDFIVTIRNKPEIVGEVKWKKLNREDITKFKKNALWLGGRKILICQKSELKEEGIEILTSKDLILLVNQQKRGDKHG